MRRATAQCITQRVEMEARMLRTAFVGCLAMLALAAPVTAMQRNNSSTYVPGRVEPTEPYSLRGSATQRTPARGGGPPTESAPPRHVPSHRRSHPLQSDNQTRRPGAVNYTGSSLKDDAPNTAHRIPAPIPANVAGDHPAARTGAHTHGRIRVRVASSNEEDFRKAHQRNEAVGGGPRSGGDMAPSH